jgi:hypothetical protein
MNRFIRWSNHYSLINNKIFACLSAEVGKLTSAHVGLVCVMVWRVKMEDDLLGLWIWLLDMDIIWMSWSLSSTNLYGSIDKSGTVSEGDLGHFDKILFIRTLNSYQD